MMRWEHLKPNHNNYISRADIENGILSNRTLLMKVLDYANDPKLIDARRRRELARRGLSTKRIFVVHGRDEDTLGATLEFLLSKGLEPVVLHLEPNLGRTVIEKFEQNAEVGFAIILLTPDDIGASRVKPDQLMSRPRQNVVLELGYFIAKLGRNRVCALKKGDLEIPSDIFGILFVDLDERGTWKKELARELRAVGYDILIT
jgi:predicted nucleotide-binding protein